MFRILRNILFVNIILLIMNCLSNEEQTKLPVYKCYKIDKEITLTGKLDDPLWEKADIVELVNTANGNKPTLITQVRLLYNDKTLYIGFHCEDDYVWGTKTDHDADIYKEECVEVFLNPASTTYQYYELNVSPKNVVFDACILSRRSQIDPGAKFTGLREYHPEDMRTLVHVEGELDKPGEAKYWNVEYAIPFTQLIGAPNIPPKADDKWRMNLYRIDFPKGGPQKFYAWNPTKKIDFHRPWLFGILKFQ